VGFGEGEKEYERKSSRELIYSSLEEAERGVAATTVAFVIA
jgi:hypothetical protein